MSLLHLVESLLPNRHKPILTTPRCLCTSNTTRSWLRSNRKKDGLQSFTITTSTPSMRPKKLTQYLNLTTGGTRAMKSHISKFRSYLTQTSSSISVQSTLYSMLWEMSVVYSNSCSSSGSSQFGSRLVSFWLSSLWAACLSTEGIVRMTEHHLKREEETYS